MLLQSSPASGGNEGQRVASNLTNQSTMRAYLEDLRLFFQRAGATGERVVLHMEPDLWGFVQQQARGDDASTVPARVGSSGLPELAGLPDTVSGLAQAVLRLRDRYAPQVLVAYHLSVWGTNNDIALSNPPNATVDALAARAADFYASLDADFDLVFTDIADRDAAFKAVHYGDGGATWWDDADFARSQRFLGGFAREAGERLVLWQLPFGNTLMRAMNNSWNHYQDNRVEKLLGEGSRERLQGYVDAGVIALLFGRGADGVTCACDANRDGVTNPPAINGNARTSLSADDDGGYFKDRARAYYQSPLSLP